MPNGARFKTLWRDGDLYAQHFAVLVLKDKLKTCSNQLTLSIINTELVKKVWFHLTTPYVHKILC